MVLEKIKDMIAEQFSVDRDEVGAEMTFKDMEADSLDIVELIMAVEEEFGLTIADEDVEGMTSVNDLVEYVKERV